MSKETEDNTVFDSEKLNAQIWSIENMEIRAHNNAIDECSKIVSKYETATSQPFLKSLMKELIQKLNQLKK